MALLLPVPFEITFRRFPRHHSKFRSYRCLQTFTHIRAQISLENSDKMSPRVKRAFERAREYKKHKEEQKLQSKDENEDDAALPPFEEASAYDQKDEKNFAMVDNTVPKEDEKNAILEDKTVEVEIIARDGIIRRKFIPPAEAFSSIKDYRNKSISSVDFSGLRFSETKPKRALPAGLNVDIQTTPSGSPPEVDIFLGDVTKFGYEAPTKTNDSSDLYKPKVASWGVFPRPENISQTYGGGRIIRPGEPLESKEEKAVREAQTKKLIEKYKQKTGQNLDPEVKASCEKVLKEGNYLMDCGRLRDALVYFEKIINDMVFESELHGLAALQWSVCLETLNRSNDAQAMYKKLSSHRNRDVMKKAKQLLFGFEVRNIILQISGHGKTEDFTNLQFGYKWLSKIF